MHGGEVSGWPVYAIASANATSVSSDLSIDRETHYSDPEALVRHQTPTALTSCAALPAIDAAAFIYRHALKRLRQGRGMGKDGGEATTMPHFFLSLKQSFLQEVGADQGGAWGQWRYGTVTTPEPVEPQPPLALATSRGRKVELGTFFAS
eukprot:SAG11_NODE_1198_length_5543_cov_25.218038_4_plen_150_part_00